MAYTIISQNNSTTTLSDGVNTITVPSRVNLTSGNFTIVEVNNNMATLEDGDGNVYRDIPCVATLADEGGIQKSTMPTASADEFGKIYQFVGTTDANYTNGYFYKGVYDTPIPSSATISQTVGEGLEDLAVNKTTFETQITESGSYEFVARLNREHITATIGTDTVRMDRDESHDVEGAVAWTPDGETYFYTEELVPDVADEVFADPDGETVAGAVASYSVEAIGWEFGGEFVDLADYGISYTPADPTATVEYSSEALGTVTVDADTFAAQVAESDLYIFDAVVTPERILATVDEAMIQYNRDADDDDADLFAWKDEHNVVVFTESATPTATAQVYSDTTKTPLGTVEAYSASSTKWYRGSDEITLATYGITITGTAEDGNSIHIQYVSEPPHQDDVITVNYTAEQATYKWQQTNVQPGGQGGGAVNSVNDIEPDENGNVELSAENINASVGGTVDSVQDHLDSLRTDLGDLADDVAEKTKKNVITLTGESGTLTAAQIAQVLDDTSVLEIVCDGIVFRLSNKDSTLTYRTYINTDCAVSSDVEFKAIYVQLNSEAANYGAWTLEEVSAGGGAVESVNGKTGAVVLSAEDVDATPQYSTMPTADSTNVGEIVQFTGTTDATYTNGHFYKCVSDGEDPATYSWTEVSMGGGSSYTAGTGIDITSGVISVAAPTLQNINTDSTSVSIGTALGLENKANAVSIGNLVQGGQYSVVIGSSARSFNQTGVVAIGYGTYISGGSYSIAIGSNAKTGAAGAIQINTSGSSVTNSDANTFKVGNANGNFEIMNANGNLPADRLASTTGLADGNYRLRLTMADGVPTLSWVAE